FTHVYGAFHTEQCGSSCCCDTVLSGSGLSNKPGFAHAFSQQSLTNDIIDLMRTGVVEVFAFQKDPHARMILRESRRFGQQCWPVNVVGVEVTKFVKKYRVFDGCTNGVFNLL